LRRHALTKVLPYPPDQMFDLVGDVARYPEFVPWITSMRTWNPRDLAPGVSAVDTEASVGFSFLRERFSTRVTRDATQRRINVTLISGPFRALRNDWRFRPDSRGTLIDFSIEFEFKTRLLDAFLAANMDRAVDLLIGRFEARARTLYGQPAAVKAEPIVQGPASPGLTGGSQT
jgi:coenzyme Q-binding protein COQ10